MMPSWSKEKLLIKIMWNGLIWMPLNGNMFKQKLRLLFVLKLHLQDLKNKKRKKKRMKLFKHYIICFCLCIDFSYNIHDRMCSQIKRMLLNFSLCQSGCKLYLYWFQRKMPAKWEEVFLLSATLKNHVGKVSKQPLCQVCCY